jgi:DNA anti-recombination protein RmuC
VPPAGYFDPYLANMQHGISTQFDGLATQMQQQLNLGFQNMNQQFQGQLNAGFQAFGQQLHNDMYQPIMTRMQNVQEGLHANIAALDSRFDDLPSSEQHQELVERQQKLQNDFNTFNTTFSGFTDHSTQCIQL